MADVTIFTHLAGVILYIICDRQISEIPLTDYAMYRFLALLIKCMKCLFSSY